MVAYADNFKNFTSRSAMEDGICKFKITYWEIKVKINININP